MVNPHGLARIRRGNYPKDFNFGCVHGTAVHPNRDLAAAAEGGERSSLGGHRKARVNIIQEFQRSHYGLIVHAVLKAERSLSRSGAELRGLKPLADPFSLLQAVEAGRGKKNGVYLPLGQLA